VNDQPHKTHSILRFGLNWVKLVLTSASLITGRFGDDLPSQSLDWCKTAKTKHNYNQIHHKKLKPCEKTTIKTEMSHFYNFWHRGLALQWSREWAKRQLCGWNVYNIVCWYCHKNILKSKARSVSICFPNYPQMDENYIKLHLPSIYGYIIVCTSYVYRRAQQYQAYTLSLLYHYLLVAVKYKWC